MTVDADAFKAFEVAGWEHQAPTYDDFFGQITQRFVAPLLDAAGVTTWDQPDRMRLLAVFLDALGDGDGFALPVSAKLAVGRLR